MNEYHIKARVSDEEQIFTIDAPDPDDALRQAIEWANQDYVSIEVYTGHPTLGNPERISTNSAPPPASSGTPIIHFKSSWWVFGYFLTGWLQMLTGVCLFSYWMLAAHIEDEGSLLWTGLGITASGSASLFFSYILELLEKGVYHLENIDTKT
ncbi:hypothetical protein OAK45_00375 [Verrucomicrobia bacterium]|nr:hypothetical protein [Verrucomicrobiota bacterium]